MKILKSNNFDEQLKELQTIPFEIKTSRGFPTLEQTKRNLCRADLVEGLYNFLQANLTNNIYLTSEGVSIEIENDSVLNWSNSKESGEFGEKSSGAITISCDIKVHNLADNAYLEDLKADEEA